MAAGGSAKGTYWFWSDWRGDQAVRRLAPAARGVWIDLLALASAGKPTGYVTDRKGRPIPLDEIARFTNCPIQELPKLIEDIVEKGAASRDRAGRLFNRRMVREAALSAKRAKAGKEGAETRWGPRENTGTRSDRLKAARAKGSHTASEWQAMQEIFGGCVKCGNPKDRLAGGVLTKDHVTPVYQGGSDAIENIQPMCRNCNSGKHKEVADYRDLRVSDWRERLAKRLATSGEERRGSLDPPGSQTIDKDTSAARASKQPLISASAFDLSGQVCTAIGWDLDDPRCVGAPWEVQRWLNQGWSGELCVATAKRVAAGRQVRNLKYFEGAIADAHANFAKPLPVAKPHAENVHVLHRSGSASGARLGFSGLALQRAARAAAAKEHG